MGADCCPPNHQPELHAKYQGRYRKVLWVALIINTTMFAVEIVSGVKADSVSLLADALGNVAVMLAALGVVGTHAAWPDLAVATIMASLALTSAWKVIRQARGELTPETQESNQ